MFLLVSVVHTWNGELFVAKTYNIELIVARVCVQLKKNDQKCSQSYFHIHC